MRSRRGAIVICLVLLALAFAATVGRAHARGAAFVIQAAGMQGPARTLAAWESTAVTETPVLQVPWRAGVLRARGYRPSRESGRGILLVPGVHAAGIDEPRLIGFARDIAAMGHPVLTVEPSDLARYQITTRT